jgi:hypothetical protein
MSPDAYGEEINLFSMNLLSYQFDSLAISEVVGFIICRKTLTIAATRNVSPKNLRRTVSTIPVFVPSAVYRFLGTCGLPEIAAELSRECCF